MGLVSKHVFFCRQNFLGVEGTRDVSMQFCGYVYNFRQLNIVHLKNTSDFMFTKLHVIWSNFNHSIARSVRYFI